jgi:PAS domain S-box-containing protein
MSVFNTLTRKTLGHLVAGGAFILLSATLLGSWLQYKQAQQRELVNLSAQAQESALVAESVLHYTVETQEGIRKAFLESWPDYQTAEVVARFDDVMMPYPDGAWRNQTKISDGHKFATGWIHKDAVMTDQLQQLIVLFYELATRYGPGAALRHDNLYFMPLAAEANMGFDPYLYPNWIFEIDNSFTHLDFEWGRLAYKQMPPDSGQLWSSPTMDLELETDYGPVFSILTPLHYGDVQLATVGTDILLNEFLQRVMPGAISSDVRMLFFQKNGQVFADTLLTKDIYPKVGKLPLSDLVGGLSQALLAATSDDAVHSGYDPLSDSYFAVATINGPRWFVGVSSSGSLLRQKAITPVLWTLFTGMVMMLILLLLFARILRKNLSEPLGKLTQATTDLASGDQTADLPVGRNDELGRLAVAFNYMANKIQARDNALRKDKEILQQTLTQLRLNEERWQAMTENASDIIAIVTEQGQFTYISQSALGMLGRTAESLINTSIYDLMDEKDANFYKGKILATVGKVYSFRVRHSDGELRYIEVISNDMRSHPALGGLVLNIRDITESIKSKEQLARQSDALRHSEKLSAMGALLAGVAHELNNPLAILMGRAALLEQKTRSKPVKEDAKRIRAAADRCGRIVRTFLSMARQKPVDRKATYLNDVILASIELLGFGLRNADINIHFQQQENLPAILADNDQIGQIIINLLMNAQQALIEKDFPRNIQIESYSKEDKQFVVITDNGDGIPEELRQRIFDPFFTTKAEGAGTGIGLSVSRAIAREHGGELSLQSSEQGASFLLELPVEEITLKAKPKPKVSQSKSASGQVLVVDDDLEIALIMVEILTNAGYKANHVHDGAAALTWLKHHSCDVIFCDIRMPGQDGPGFWHSLCKLNPALSQRVAFITGDTLSASVEPFLKETKQPWLEKPFSPEDLLKLASQLLATTSDK